MKTVFFKFSSDFKANIICKFDDDLKNLRTYHVLFHTREAKNETRYNNWHFTTPALWDGIDGGFWYSPNTTILVFTEEHIIGKG